MTHENQPIRIVVHSYHNTVKTLASKWIEAPELVEFETPQQEFLPEESRNTVWSCSWCSETFSTLDNWLIYTFMLIPTQKNKLLICFYRCHNTYCSMMECPYYNTTAPNTQLNWVTGPSKRQSQQPVNNFPATTLSMFWMGPRRSEIWLCKLSLFFCKYTPF